MTSILARTNLLFEQLVGTGPGETATYGGWQAHFRAEIALLGNNCSPVVPQPFSSVSQYTDLSSQIIGESQINTLAAATAYLRRPDSMQPRSSGHFHLDVLSAIRGSETERRERMTDYSSPIWS